MELRKCRRVLVIEDNEDMAESLRDLLLFDEEREVEIANNGATGITKAEVFKPDLVICDIGLPDIDGYQVVRTLREKPSLSDTRMLALTGYAQDDDVRRCTEAGFDGHLAKPLTTDQLDGLFHRTG